MTNFKNLFKKYESLSACEASQRYAKARLNRAGTMAARGISKRLDLCCSGVRCHSGACPVCARRYRLRLLPQAEWHLIDAPFLLSMWWLPPNGVVRSDMLDRFDVVGLIDQQVDILQRAAPDAIGIGGVGLDLNLSDASGPRWTVYTRLLLAASNTSGGVERLRRAHPMHRTYGYCFDVKPVSDLPNALSNAFKHRVFARSYNFGAPHGERTSFRPLPVSHAIRADLFQERWPLWNRLILHGVNGGFRTRHPKLRCVEAG